MESALSVTANVVLGLPGDFKHICPTYVLAWGEQWAGCWESQATSDLGHQRGGVWQETSQRSHVTSLTENGASHFGVEDIFISDTWKHKWASMTQV